MGGVPQPTARTVADLERQCGGAALVAPALSAVPFTSAELASLGPDDDAQLAVDPLFELQWSLENRGQAVVAEAAARAARARRAPHRNLATAARVIRTCHLWSPVTRSRRMG